MGHWSKITTRSGKFLWKNLRNFISKDDKIVCNYFFRKLKILLYHGFPRTILSTKRPSLRFENIHWSILTSTLVANHYNIGNLRFFMLFVWLFIGNWARGIHFWDQNIHWRILTGALVANHHIVGHLSTEFTCCIWGPKWRRWYIDNNTFKAWRESRFYLRILDSLLLYSGRFLSEKGFKYAR